MRYISKLTISNARRFAQNVEIEFANGATILLAPNGTGKTTVFEAIEMALTGKVNRLSTSPIAFIGEGKQEVEIRVDFTDGKYCEVKFKKGADPILTGNHAELFTNINDIPYQLRLTHLLEQRGKNWFVSADEKSAANQLDKLSIGSDVNKIIGNKQSLLRALTQKNDLLYSDLDKYKKEVDEFHKLISERNDNFTNSTLISLKELIDKLKAIYGLTDRTVEFEVKEDSDAILGFAEQTISALDSKQAELNKYKIELSVFEPKIESYIEATRNIDSNTAELNILNEQISELKLQIDSTTKEKNSYEGNFKSLQTEYDHLINTNKLFIINAEKQAYLIVLQSECSEKKAELIQIKDKLEKIISSINGFNELKDIHNQLNKAIDDKILESNKNQKLKEIQIKWVELNTIIEDFENIKLPYLYKNKEIFELSKNRLLEQLDELIKILSQKNDTLKLLQEASNAIQEAVSTIANQIDKNRNDCPVCGAIYNEPPLLSERISISLEKINPAIKILIDEIYAINENIQKIKNEIVPIDESITLSSREIQNYLHQKENSIKIITEDYSLLFPTCKTAEEALTYIIENENKIRIEIEKLNGVKESLAQLPASEIVNNSILEKQTTERQLIEIENKIREQETDLKILKGEIEKNQIQLSGVSQVDLLEEIKDVETKLIEQKEKKHENLNTINDLTNKLKEVQKNKFDVNEIISINQGQQNKVYEEWKFLNLENQPNGEIFKKTTSEITRKIEHLTGNQLELVQIKEEIAKWKGYERHIKLDTHIKSICNGKNENEYLADLQKNYDETNQKFVLLSERRKAIEDFYSKIIIEQQNIHRYFESINEPWDLLLRKIVLNPLFTKSRLLSSSTYRNQAIAKVESQLHDTKIRVEDIASEAQLTDLQITFLLAMANKYKWTDLKTLLLDDPTQHHDLVHASSVFDILRDYILDYNFQIVLATHDSIQANLFNKKLTNDGIPINIYKLISNPNGVIAERIN